MSSVWRAGQRALNPSNTHAAGFAQQAIPGKSRNLVRYTPSVKKKKVSRFRRLDRKIHISNLLENIHTLNFRAIFYTLFTYMYVRCIPLSRLLNWCDFPAMYVLVFRYILFVFKAAFFSSTSLLVVLASRFHISQILFRCSGAPRPDPDPYTCTSSFGTISTTDQVCSAHDKG